MIKRIVKIGVVIIVLICLLLTFLGDSDRVGGVRMANEMEKYALEYIEKHKILNNTEEISAYYDVTTELDGTEAAILTNERIIYHKNGQTLAMNLEDISSVTHEYKKLLGDIIEITSNEGKMFKIEIAPLNSGESFYNALNKLLQTKSIKVNNEK